MARGMHRHRRIRLDNLRDTKIATRAHKKPGKIKARARRDVNVIAKIKATKPGTGYSGEIQSWLSRRLDKPFTKISADEILKTIS
jgi:hypothetical protein